MGVGFYAKALRLEPACRVQEMTRTLACLHGMGWDGRGRN